MRNWSKNQMKLVLIRHGATKSNRENRYVGKTDEPLCMEGIKELKNAKSLDNYPSVAYVFSSPMKRCVETAGILYPNRVPIMIPEWTEIDFGDFEGKNYIDLQDNLSYRAWIDSNGTLPFPNGESREKFNFRCGIGFCKMVEILLQTEDRIFSESITVGAIVHGGIIMSLLSTYGGGEYFDYQIPNGGGYLCILETGKKEMKIEHIKKL